MLSGRIPECESKGKTVVGESEDTTFSRRSVVGYLEDIKIPLTSVQAKKGFSQKRSEGGHRFFNRHRIEDSVCFTTGPFDA